MALYTTDYNIGLGRKWVWREWGAAGQVNGRLAGPCGGKADVPRKRVGYLEHEGGGATPSPRQRLVELTALSGGQIKERVG